MTRLWNLGEVQWGGVQSPRPRKNSRDVFGAKWWFMKARGQDPWGESTAALGCERWLIIYHEVGGGEEKGRLRKYFHMLKKAHKIPEALPLSS